MTTKNIFAHLKELLEEFTKLFLLFYVLLDY